MTEVCEGVGNADAGLNGSVGVVIDIMDWYAGAKDATAEAAV